MIPGRTGSENPHGKACKFASVPNNDEAQGGGLSADTNLHSLARFLVIHELGLLT